LNQLALPRSLMKLDETVIAQPKDLLRSFVICADLGGLDDSQAATAAGMDPSTWSQFKNGTRGIKPLELNTFMDQCGNEMPLAYWAYSRGYLLSPRETELERRLRVKDEENKKLKDENRLLREIAVGKAA
jgi:hypothetical protein